jgi:hypothetical protein
MGIKIANVSACMKTEGMDEKPPHKQLESIICSVIS